MSGYRSSSHSSCNHLKRHRRGSSGGTAVTDDDIDDIDVDMEDEMMEDEAQVVVMFDHATSAASANGTTRLQSSEEDEGRGAEDRLSPESDDLDLDDGAR